MVISLSDLTACNFYLWGSLKDKGYKKIPHKVEELEQNIMNEIINITVLIIMCFANT